METVETLSEGCLESSGVVRVQIGELLVGAKAGTRTTRLFNVLQCLLRWRATFCGSKIEGEYYIMRELLSMAA